MNHKFYLPIVSGPGGPPTPPPVDTAHGFSLDVVTLINEIRVSHGLHALAIDWSLMRVAQAHADDMATRNYFGHNTLDGPSWSERILAVYQPWAYIGENIAGGYGTAAGVVKGWIESEGHRHNILSPLVYEIGVGYARNENALYKTRWVADFGARPGQGENHDDRSRHVHSSAVLSGPHRLHDDSVVASAVAQGNPEGGLDDNRGKP